MTQPCLALFGEHSPFLATADYLGEHLPDCRGRRIPDAKHRAPEENPERFVDWPCVSSWSLFSLPRTVRSANERTYPWS